MIAAYPRAEADEPPNPAPGAEALRVSLVARCTASRRLQFASADVVVRRGKRRAASRHAGECGSH